KTRSSPFANSVLEVALRRRLTPAVSWKWLATWTVFVPEWRSTKHAVPISSVGSQQCWIDLRLRVVALLLRSTFWLRDAAWASQTREADRWFSPRAPRVTGTSWAKRQRRCRGRPRVFLPTTLVMCVMFLR